MLYEVITGEIAEAAILLDQGTKGAVQARRQAKLQIARKRLIG